jgi:cold shock CspA family protein
MALNPDNPDYSTGRVKSYRTHSGYGWITCDRTGQDYFFHVSRVIDRIELWSGDPVEFYCVPSFACCRGPRSDAPAVRPG